MQSNNDKLTRLPKTCLWLGASLLLSSLFLLGTLQILAGFGKGTDAVLADDELVVFSDVTEFAGVDLMAPQWGAVWGDYDADGYQDLYVGNHFDTPNLYRNNGDGTFTDLRASAGLKAGPGDWHGPAWGDYDNDGHLDLYVVTGRAIAGGSDFYVNDGDGTFTERAVAAGITNDDGRGRNPRWVDYDRDGDLDIFVANDARDIAPDVLYRNNDDGTFTDVAVQAGVASSESSLGAAWADYDGDGHSDFMLTMIGVTSALYHNQGDGTFVDTTNSAGLGSLWSNSAAWGDYDNDGDLDLYRCRGYEYYQDKLVWDSKVITAIVRTPRGGEEGLVFTTTAPTVTFDLWRSDRKLYPSEVKYGSTNQHPSAIPFALDDTTSHIGKPSYTLGVDYGVFIWRDSATGPWQVRWVGDADDNYRFFGRITTAGDFAQVIAVDFDSPWSPSSPNLLYSNNGDGTFERVEIAAGVDDDANSRGAQWVDFDNDGDLDLYVTNHGDTYIGNQPNRLYRNNGDGTFTDVAAAVGLAFVNDGNDMCSAWADYDNDGFLDFYLANSTFTGYLAGPHKLYRNEGNSNHWLQIAPTGTNSNRPGIGAKIQVTTGDLVQFREVGVSSSGACHNSLLAHFGLGSYTKAGVITVTWPSGYIQVLQDVPADQVLHITEGLEDDDENKIYIPAILKAATL
jgi:hypothetical protein